jgi:hypothetical protein
MDPNTHSTQRPPRRPTGLAAVAAGLEQLAAEDPDQLPDAVLAQEVLALQELLDGLAGQWLKRLAVVDGRGAAGAEADQQVGSTAAWLRGWAVRPQLAVVVDLDSLLHPHGSLGGETGWAGPLDPEACRRLACDAAVTRVVVSRHLGGQQDPTGQPSGQPLASGHHHPDQWVGADGLPSPCCVSAAATVATRTGGWRSGSSRL